MPQTLEQHHLHELARLGAQARITELQAELSAIHAAFPDLNGVTPRRRPGRRPKRAPAAADATLQEASAPSSAEIEPEGGEEPAARTGGGSAWTPARRKAQAEMMRRYWAKRKGGKKR
jgi:hypothetical protein